MSYIDEAGNRMHALVHEQLAISRAKRGSVFVGASVAGVFAMSVVTGSGAFAATHHKTNKKVDHKSAGVVIATAKNAMLGTILVGQKKTVYTLIPTKVRCSAECLSVWPEVTLPKGVVRAGAGAGVNGSMLGTVARAGGVRQVTYEGKALYRFSGDATIGSVNGNGAKDQWGTWSVFVTVKAKKRSPAKAGTISHPTTTTTSSSYGY